MRVNSYRCGLGSCTDAGAAVASWRMRHGWLLLCASDEALTETSTGGKNPHTTTHTADATTGVVLPAVLPYPPGRAEDPAPGIHVREARSWLVDDVYHLRARIDYVLSTPVSDALNNGLPLVIELQVQVVRDYFGLWDQEVASSLSSINCNTMPCRANTCCAISTAPRSTAILPNRPHSMRWVISMPCRCWTGVC